MADEFMARALGCAGHPLVQTPNLDRLASRGVRFTNAYTPSPMCVPARGAFQTGLHVDKVGCWSSAEPYNGFPASFGHVLRDNGVRVASVGKLHFKTSLTDNGFDPELLPLHVVDGIGWMPSLLRRDPLDFDSSSFANDVGPGESSYSRYDKRVEKQTRQWLNDPTNTDSPWVLFCSLVSPHYPLRSPDAFFDLYPVEDMDWPFCYAPDERPTHPVVKQVMDLSAYDKHFTPEKVRIARAAYYGLCSYVDDMVGNLIETLEENDLIEDTRIIFTSDHGEMLGNHGAWTKMLMYEDSVSIPLILGGPGIEQGKVNSTPVTLLDIAAMVCRDHGCVAFADQLDGQCLGTLSQTNQPERAVLSQYHDGWSPTGYFMVRWNQWKFIHYQDYPPQLFDLENDPQERRDLGADPGYRSQREDGFEQLTQWLDPAEVTQRAFQDQEKCIERLGGVVGVRQNAALHFNYTPISDETHQVDPEP